MNRKFADRFFKWLFSAVALFSVLALTAIVLFVFVQGVRPFFAATADGIVLVPQRINGLTVNGEDFSGRPVVNLPAGTERILVTFPSAGSENPGDEILELAFDSSARNPEAALTFVRNDRGIVSSARAYEFTVKWPSPEGVQNTAEPALGIMVPEPPYGVFAFLAGLEWQPTVFKTYGILPMITATLMAAFGAILLGVPLALLCAVFMSEFLPPKPAALVRGGIELLAGIPSVVYGFFGLVVIVPAVREFFGIPAGNTMLSAIIVLSLMILPTITTIAETSLRAVPLSVREASLALGASSMQTAWKVVLPHANSGVIAGVILGMSRAVGETMAVILVAGNSPQLVFSPLESVRTLTATIALEMGYASGRHGEMLFSIGVVLFSVILVLNGAILWVSGRMEKS